VPVTVFDIYLTPNVWFLLSRRKDTVFLIKNVDQIHLYGTKNRTFLWKCDQNKKNSIIVYQLARYFSVND